MKKWVNLCMRNYLTHRYRYIQQFMDRPHEVQTALLKRLLESTRHTQWGRAFDYRSIRTPEQYASRVPVQDYESMKPFIERMMYGEKDVLWGGRVRWFAKSSGTTSDRSKFIPVTHINLTTCHIKGGWDTASILYYHRPESTVFEGKMLIMGGSTEAFAPFPGTRFGDVSAIMLNHLPAVGRLIYAPDMITALTSNTEEKIQRIARSIIHEDIRMVGGVPTWMVVLFRYVQELTGKSNLLEVWPNLQVYTHGGVSFTPYREQFRNFLPSPDFVYLEAYNASEGYFATKPDLISDDLLLLLDNGIYYEFLPIEEWDKENPQAIPLSAVEVGKHYAPVISTNAGLWRYVPGDTVEFTSVQPYKIKVSGRTQQFVNAFGEEVMVANTDKAIAETCRTTGAIVTEYTVAPVYFDNSRKGGHEWVIEFEKDPADLESFINLLDTNLQHINSDYEAKRYKSMAMERLRLNRVPKGTFLNWMKLKGKFGGQHKVPRLSNHRSNVEEILRLVGQNV